jgi:mRNA-degrading endonuclease toxin of MazEF toxin-antitoxin module
MKRGDVVMVPFPYQDKPGEKIRPAVIVQRDSENQRLANTILVMITGNLQDAGRPTTVLVDPAQPDGAGSGLHGPSLVKCYNLATVRQRRVLQIIGHLAPSVMKQVDAGLKAALDLPWTTGDPPQSLLCPAIKSPTDSIFFSTSSKELFILDLMKRNMVSLDFDGSPYSLELLQRSLEKAAVKVRRHHERGFLSVESSAPESASIEHHLVDLQQSIDFSQLSKYLTTIKENVKIYLRLGVLYDTATCTVLFPPGILAQLGSHGINLEVSCYPCQESDLADKET